MPERAAQHGEGAARPGAVVTGASSGIGAATARALAAEGYRTVLAARRMDRLQALAAEIGGEPIAVDVTDPGSVADLAARVGDCDLVVHCAGGALGVDPLEEAEEERWRWMFEANVLGMVRLTKALLPRLIDSGAGHVIAVTSIAGFESYPGGSGYGAAKHAQRAALRTLRLELLGRPVRVTEVSPGMVETEFSVVRLDGDREAARKVYAGMTPLTAEDVAECIRWAATLPAHVNIDEIVVRPRDQAAATMVARHQDEFGAEP